MKKKIINLIFKYACLFLLGTGILYRFVLLNIGYEYDEIFTAITSNPSIPLTWIWTNWLMVDVHPPLYNILLWFYNHIVPYGAEIWLRLPSVFFGISGLVLAWVMFPRRYGKTAQLLFVSMFSAHLYLIFYTQHARAYALMFLLGVILLFWFLDIARALCKGRLIPVKKWLGWGVVSLILCWTHYFGALVFGAYSLILLALAFKHKHYRKTVFGITAGVTLLFLPWLVPNFLFNASMERFDGNWWGNRMNSPLLLPRLISFFFSSLWGLVLYATLLIMGGWNYYKQYKFSKKWPFMQEQVWLGLAVLIVFGIASLLSIKIFLLLGRYFMAFLPALVLLSTFLFLPFVKKRVMGKAVFVLFLLQSFFAVFIQTNYFLTYPQQFPAKFTAEFYRDYAPEKEFFVIAMEAFPVDSLEALYSYYPNQVFGMNARVTELFHLDKSARNEALKRKENAFIWMPNCSTRKLSLLSEEWDRAIGLEGPLGNSCVLQLGEEREDAPEEWKKSRKNK
jgi:hypothetical protein